MNGDLSWCDDLFRRRPAWVKGSISLDDSRFLAKTVAASGADHVVEIGTASGYSTAVIAAALHRAGREFTVASFDVTEKFYADQTKPVGQATRDLVPELMERIQFNIFGSCADLGGYYEPDSLDFVFIDALHRHPWPTIDALLCLPYVQAGATVVLHDINLPVINPAFPAWGAHHLFHDLDAPEKAVADHRPPNIGSFTVPHDKEELRQQLLVVLDGHDWEMAVPEELVTAAREPTSR